MAKDKVHHGADSTLRRPNHVLTGQAQSLAQGVRRCFAAKDLGQDPVRHVPKKGPSPRPVQANKKNGLEGSKKKPDPARAGAHATILKNGFTKRHAGPGRAVSPSGRTMTSKATGRHVWFPVRGRAAAERLCRISGARARSSKYRPICSAHHINAIQATVHERTPKLDHRPAWGRAY